MTTELCVVDSSTELDRWVRIRNELEPDEPVTTAQVAASAEANRLLLLAVEDGDDAGCGIAAPSSFGGRAFIAARVLQPFRRRGIGTLLVRSLAEHGRAIGRTGVNAFVDATDSGSRAFAEGFGLVETDYQLRQERTVAKPVRTEPPPPGVELTAIGNRRDELLPLVWEAVGRRGLVELPLPEPVDPDPDEWLRQEATRPEGSFVARVEGEIVGYAGLLVHGGEPTIAQHGLTTVRADYRRHGVATALKQAQIAWAAGAGVVRLVTWTQRGNEPMQSLNRRLGYVDAARVLTMQSPLPL